MDGINYYSKEIYEIYKNVYPGESFFESFKKYRTYLKRLIVTLFSSYALMVVFFAFILFFQTSVFLILLLVSAAIFVISFFLLVLHYYKNKEDYKSTKSPIDYINDFSNELQKKRIDKNVIEIVINNNKDLDSYIDRFKQRKYNNFFKFGFTMYISSVLFFLKDFWSTFKDSNSVDYSLIAFSLIFAGGILIIIFVPIFLKKVEFNEIKYFNDALYNVLIHIELEDELN